MRFLILISVIAFSCAPWNIVPRKYKVAMDCFNYEYTGLDSTLNIHGIFFRQNIDDNTGIYAMRDGKMTELRVDTTYSSVYFFKDGTFLGGLGCGYLSPQECIGRMDLTNENTLVQRTSWIGTYKVHGDIIKTQTIIKGGANSWGGFENWYRILDRNRIVEFYRRPLAITYGDHQKSAYNSSFSNSEPFVFYPIDSEQSSSNWLQTQSWINCKF